MRGERSVVRLQKRGRANDQRKTGVGWRVKRERGSESGREKGIEGEKEGLREGD